MQGRKAVGAAESSMQAKSLTSSQHETGWADLSGAHASRFYEAPAKRHCADYVCYIILKFQDETFMLK